MNTNDQHLVDKTVNSFCRYPFTNLMLLLMALCSGATLLVLDEYTNFSGQKLAAITLGITAVFGLAAILMYLVERFVRISDPDGGVLFRNSSLRESADAEPAAGREVKALYRVDPAGALARARVAFGFLCRPPSSSCAGGIDSSCISMSMSVTQATPGPSRTTSNQIR